MGFRTVVIRKPCKLSYKNECLIIRADEANVIHLSEIHTLLIDSTMVTLTSYLLCALMEHKVKVVFCDERRNPLSEVVPYYGCHNASGQVRKQMMWTQEQKAKVWQSIIRQKIKNQARLLNDNHPLQADMLLDYAANVMPGDETNREGHAAKVYFNRIFGNGFNRNVKSDANSALNYGYALVLSTMNKELASRGYLTQLGIFEFWSYVILDGTETVGSAIDRYIAFWSYVILDGTETGVPGWKINQMFWSYVILDGTETMRSSWNHAIQFWSYVILDGTETKSGAGCYQKLFWSYVILDGTETIAATFPDKYQFWSYVILDGTETRFFMSQINAEFWSYVILDGTET